MKTSGHDREWVFRMDKKKTGALIKEARVKKNYTQSELGDLIGVSNKAVSRWENGDSFPDVGILENLATVLDVRLQDIITGGSDENDESAVTEVVRVTQIQQKEKKRRYIRISIFVVFLLIYIFEGYAVLGRKNIWESNNKLIYTVFFAILTYAVVLYGSIFNLSANKINAHFYERWMKLLSLISLFWCIFLNFGTMHIVINGESPLGMQLSSIGPFINWQLLVLFCLNFVMVIIAGIRYEIKNVQIHWGYLTSMAGMQLTILYGDFLHNMSSIDETISSLLIRTIIVLGMLVIALVVSRVVKVRTKNTSR